MPKNPSLPALREALIAAGAPESAAARAVAELAKSLSDLISKRLQVQSESPDMTTKQVEAYRLESASTVQRKMRAGTYESYLSGPDKRLITRCSVESDRENCLAAGSRFAETPAVPSDSMEFGSHDEASAESAA